MKLKQFSCTGDRGKCAANCFTFKRRLYKRYQFADDVGFAGAVGSFKSIQRGASVPLSQNKSATSFSSTGKLHSSYRILKHDERGSNEAWHLEGLVYRR